MSKKCMQVTLNIIVDTDLTSPDDIIEHLDFTPTPEDEVVEVYDAEVENFQITGSK